MPGMGLKVVGLDEFRRGLRGINAGLPKTVRAAASEVADELIDAIRPKIPRRTGRAAASLKVESSQGQAQITAGGPRAPWFGWLDFGGRTGRKKSVVRPFIRGGRYLFPTLAHRDQATQHTMRDAVADLASANGIEVG